jgi:signal transduction histidine kinase
MKTYLAEFHEQVKAKADRLMNYFLFVYMLAGLLFATYYDTWHVAFGVGGIGLVAYYSSRYLLPNSKLYQYVLSAVMGLFTAQFIYQLHGMFEMHFTAFIGSAILIIYRNWKLQIPIAVVVILHHAAFGYLQFLGFDKFYFTQLEVMSMETFMIHILLATTIFFICGFWSYNFKMSGEKSLTKSFEIGRLQEINNQNDQLIEMAREINRSNAQLQKANDELATIFNSVEEVLFSINTKDRKLIQISKACNTVYGYNQQEFTADPCIWLKLLHPGDRALLGKTIKKLKTGQTCFSRHRIFTKEDELHWIEMKLIPTRDANNKLVRIDGIANNVTDRVKLEKKLAFEKSIKQQQLTAAAITAQENERSFLGEELHDNINPILATAKLYLECAIGEEERRVALVKESRGFILTAMNEIRKLSRSLVPPSLGEISLTDALNDMIEHLKVVHKIQFITNWNVTDEKQFDDKLKLTIYRIMQEQMNNILKHSHAGSVIISLKQQDTSLEFKITDDGVGFDSSTKKNGVGLQNIISRTEMCNGKLAINTSPGNGCQLHFHFKTAQQLLDPVRA